MTLISAHDLTRSYGATQVLAGVSITIEDRDRVGLIGRNGAGKSTLVRILTGREDAESGEIMRRRDLRVAAVDQVPDLDPHQTVWQAVLSGLAPHLRAHERRAALESEMSDASGAQLASLVDEHAELAAELERLGGWNVEHEAEAIIDALSIPGKERTVGTLSLGEQRRVALAIGLLAQPDLLVLDEPTNHLDVATIEWLQDKLTSWPGAVLLVSHDRYFLDDVTNRIAEIDAGRLYTYEGAYTDYLLERAEREAIESRTQANRRRAIKSELVWVRASAPARTTKQKARLIRFDALVAEPAEAPKDEVSFRLPHPPRIGKTILELHGLTKSFGERTLIKELDLLLKKGDRIGIIGENGAGKSTLVKMILGEVEPTSGQIVRGTNTKIVYADQARADLDDDHTVVEEVAGDDDKVYVGDRAVQVQTFLEQLLFDEALQRTRVAALSGGEKSRVSLAKALRHAGNLLILDEPTNDLDLATLRVLEDALVAYPGCALVISHDRYFLDRVATAILAFEGDGKVVLYEGSHMLYRERLAQRKAAEAPRPAVEASAPAPTKTSPRGPRTRRTFPEDREFSQMEAKILQTEERVAELEAEISDPARIRALGPKLEGKMKALEKTRGEVESLYARWAQLSELEPYGG